MPSETPDCQRPTSGPHDDATGVGTRGEHGRERERLLAELELERSRLAAVFASTPSLLAVVRGPHHVLELANAAYLQLIGRPDAVGRPLLEAVTELRGQGFELLLQEVMATGVPFVGREVPIGVSPGPGKPPEERYFDFVYLPLVEPDGAGGTHITGVIAHGNDITDQVLARRDAERARERADRLQRLTAALAATTTPEEVADVVVAQGVAASGAATGMLALGAAAGGARPSDEMTILRRHGPAAPAALDAPDPAAECLRTGEPFFLESRDEAVARFPTMARAWDALGTGAVAAVPLTVAEATVGAMSFTWTAPRPLTLEDREFFLALGRQAAQALERARLLAAERAARDDAEAAGREAEQANRAKSAFLATMSHELRTPLNAMIGYTQLLELGLAGPLTEQQRAYLERLTASSQHLLGLVDDVLDLSTIEAGETRVAHRDAWTGTATRTALDLVRPQADAKGVRLVDGRLGSRGVAYVGDDDRVRQIVLNLLSNAIKFTRAGGTVVARCDTVPDAPDAAMHLRGRGPWAFVRVEDTGVGIPVEEQGRIFEPFHQVERGHTRRQGGTGLGLAISRRLARLMGGDLTVESTPGRGATFTLWLPAAGASEPGVEASGARDARGAPGIESVDAPGLAAIGAALRESIDDVLTAYTERMRGDPAIPRAAHLRRSAVEDHALSLLADLAQSLVIVGEAGPDAAELLRDGSTIQCAIAEAHGARRRAQGFDEAAVRRDHQILREEVERVVRERLRVRSAGGVDADVALSVLFGLVERAEAVSVSGWRAAVRAASARGADDAGP